MLTIACLLFDERFDRCEKFSMLMSNPEHFFSDKVFYTDVTIVLMAVVVLSVLKKYDVL